MRSGCVFHVQYVTRVGYRCGPIETRQKTEKNRLIFLQKRLGGADDDGGDESEEEESDEDDYDFDDDDEGEVDDSCPPGCDITLYEKVRRVNLLCRYLSR